MSISDYYALVRRAEAAEARAGELSQRLNRIYIYARVGAPGVLDRIEEIASPVYKEK